MDWALFWGIITAVLTGVLIVMGIVFWYRPSPKRSMAYEVESRRIVQVQSRELEVFYSGNLVEDPYLTTVKIASRSRADIARGTFEDRPVWFNFKVPIIPGSFQSTGELEVAAFDTGFALPPQKIEPNQQTFLTFMTDGRPGGPEVNNSLVDVKVVSGLKEERRGTDRLVSRAAAVTGFLTMILVFVSLFLSSQFMHAK